jgi:DNA-binding response OmpR family regulator
MSKKILVIDDDAAILDAVSLVLREEGYDVRTTPKSEAVYEEVNTFNPDAIILDVLLSGNDGRTICKNLKSNDKTKKIPVIMVSAHPSAKDGIKKYGADDFLAKPFELDDLLNKVEKYT